VQARLPSPPIEHTAGRVSHRRRCTLLLPQENDIQREFAVHRSEHDYATAETWKWLLSILIGAVMGVLAFLVDWGIDAMNSFKFSAVRAAVAESGARPCLVGRTGGCLARSGLLGRGSNQSTAARGASCHQAALLGAFIAPVASPQAASCRRTSHMWASASRLRSWRVGWSGEGWWAGGAATPPARKRRSPGARRPLAPGWPQTRSPLVPEPQPCDPRSLGACVLLLL
jgi:hypothetical protein